MVEINPYLNFNGNCAEAFKLYEKVLGGKIVMMMTNGDSPMKDQTPKERLNAVMHAQIQVGNSIVMGSDTPPDRYTAPSRGIHVSLVLDSASEADRIFAELSEGGSVNMPIEETFWALRFGICTDRFGIPWMFNCMKPM